MVHDAGTTIDSQVGHQGVKDQIDVKVTAEFDSASGSVRVPFVAVYKRRSAIELGELSGMLKRQDLGEYVDLIRDSVVGWRNLEAIRS